jgi:hypothetical protein
VKNAAEYLAEIKALIVMNPKIVHWTALREEIQGDAGLIRCKLMLHDGEQIGHPSPVMMFYPPIPKYFWC